MPLLEISNLKKSYAAPDGGAHVVVDVPAFQLDAQAQVALSGESGSGKTTFLNLIAGILAPDGGSIKLNGQELAGLPESARDRIRATTIGYIFQTFNLLQGYTTLENVLLGMSFGPGADREFAKSLLKRVGLDAKLNHLPRQLSTGQQQRVAVARAMVHDPRMIVCDEPTSALDSESGHRVMTLMRQFALGKDRVLVVVTHDARIFEFADRIARMEDGRITRIENPPGRENEVQKNP